MYGFCLIRSLCGLLSFGWAMILPRKDTEEMWNSHFSVLTKREFSLAATMAATGVFVRMW